MKLVLTGRHVDVTPALKTFTREKLKKLSNLIDDLGEVHVILTVEKHRHTAEVVAHGRHLSLSARGVTADMYSSIGECIERLERQAKKHRAKFATKRRRAAPRPGSATPKSTPEGGVDRDGRQRIVRTETFSKKPMSVEEAALQVKGSDFEFFVFRNERSREVNVLYRRKDGSLGLIEPEG